MNTGYAADFALMKFNIQFNSILPDNLSEVIGYLSAARPGEAILSKESVVNLNPAIKNKQEEMDRLSAESTQDVLPTGTLNL